MRGVFFRSDTRHPVDDGIFANGFLRKDPRFRGPELDQLDENSAPDVIPKSAVCFTKDFFAAPLFPLKDLTADSWVYALDLDVRNVFNTQQAQYEWVENHGLNSRGVGRAKALVALWPMFGQERALPEIAARDVVGALLVRRRFAHPDIGSYAEDMSDFHGAFAGLEYRPNPNYRAVSRTEDKAESVAEALTEYIADPPQFVATASRDGGVVRSVRK